MRSAGFTEARKAPNITLPFHVRSALFEERAEKSLILAVRYVVLNSPKTKGCSLFNFFCFLLSIAEFLF